MRIQKIEDELMKIKASDFVVELKFSDKTLFDLEILYKKNKKKLDEFQIFILKNKSIFFLEPDFCPSKRFEQGLLLSYDNKYFVQKMKQVKYTTHKIENIF